MGAETTRKYSTFGLDASQGAGATTAALSRRRRRRRHLVPKGADGDTWKVRAAKFGITILHGAALGVGAAVRAVRQAAAYLRGRPGGKGGLE